ncbi:hypothetical protein BDN67DRAFT_974654, partial [Paxillus ammoniavirescens]
MSSLPNELWMNVFEELGSPKDLAAVVRTNKRFQSLGQRVLYNHVIWTDVRKFVENYPFLQANPTLHTVPRSLTLGISEVCPHNERIEQINRARGIIHPNGDIQNIPRSSRAHEARVLEEIGIISPIELLASEDLTQILYTQAAAFTNLRELNFMGMVLPNAFYSFVHSFPTLDKLTIEDCTPPIRPVPTLLHPKNLPITELTILGLRGRRDPRELRSFGEAHQLRVIRFDWTCYIYKHFCDPPTPPNIWPQVGGFVNIAHLQAGHAQHINHNHQAIIPAHENPTPSPHIHTIDVKFPTQKSWQSYVPEPHDQLLNPFVEFLTKFPRVTNLRIRNFLPCLRLPASALPNLACYHGPLTTIKSVVSGQRRIKRLDIRDTSASLVALEKAFREIEVSGGGANLESLSVLLGWWDDEILYAIRHHFRGLSHLEIMYREGDPSEETVLGMGAHFFGEMPNLSSVHIFRVIPPGVDNVGSIADRLSARGYPHHSIQLVLGELIGAQGPVERPDLDDAVFEEAKYVAGSSGVSSSGDGEESEEMTLRELINAWNRYCPSLLEVQLKAGYVWRRAGAEDVWTQRKTVPSRGAGPRLLGEGWF